MAKKTAPILQVDKVSKSYDKLKAVSNVCFSSKPGTITALIGPNGSGKTTLLKMIVGLHSIDKGSVTIGQANIVNQPIEAKTQLGYVPDNPSGFDYLTGWELLQFTSRLKQQAFDDIKKDLTDLIDQFELKPLLDKRLGDYSRGNRQKVAFLAATIGNPKLLIIDEPIVGLDPKSIEVFGEALKDFAQKKGAVLFSTHILEFGKRFGDNLLVMHKGRIKLDTKITNRTSLTKHYQRITTK